MLPLNLASLKGGLRDILDEEAVSNIHHGRGSVLSMMNGLYFTATPL
jgi:hypothetical protein